MTAIYKYPLNCPIPPGDATIAFDLKMPPLAHIIHAGLDPQGDLCLWARVDTETEEFEIRRVRIFGTGRECNAPPENYFATVLQGDFVWHIFIV